MKYWTAIAFLSLWLISCGKEKAAPKGVTTSTPPPAAPNKGWTEAQSTSLKIQCVTNGTRLFPQFQKSQFDLYCQCLVDAITHRWSYDDFNKNRMTYIETLDRDKTDEACIDKAGFYSKPSTTQTKHMFIE